MSAQSFWKKTNPSAGLAALFLWLLSFAAERLSIDLSARAEHWGTYLAVKLLLLLLLFLLCRFLRAAFAGVPALFRKGSLKERYLASPLELRALLCAVPVWAVLSFVWIRRGMHINWEENSITEAALQFDLMEGVFNFLTPYLHLAVRMLLPGKYAVVFAKIAVFGTMTGVCIARMGAVFHTPLSALLYLFVFVPPSLSHSYSIHRCPTYGMIYFWLFIRLFCDHRERRSIGKMELALLLLLFAALTQWRSEGIYFLFLGPAVLMLAYRIRPAKKRCAGILALYLLFQLLIYLPQASLTTAQSENYSARRSQPFYDYVLTGMLRNGLDREKNAEDLAVCNEFIDLSRIDILNDHYGDHAYDEGFASYGDTEYYCLIDGTSDEQLLAYEAAMRRIILRNPWVYIKTQIGGFHHISVHYDSLCLSSVFGNLWVVAAWIVGLWVWALWKKEWCLFACVSCPLIHACITTILLPAAYIKYYYPEYMFAAATFVFMLCRFAAARREKLR